MSSESIRKHMMIVESMLGNQTSEEKEMVFAYVQNDNATYRFKGPMTLAQARELIATEFGGNDNITSMEAGAVPVGVFSHTEKYIIKHMLDRSKDGWANCDPDADPNFTMVKLACEMAGIKYVDLRKVKDPVDLERISYTQSDVTAEVLSNLLSPFQNDVM